MILKEQIAAAAREIFARGGRWPDVAAALGVPLGTVTAYGHKLGIPSPHRGRPWTESETKELAEIRPRMTIQQCADHLGRTYNSVQRKLVEMRDVRPAPQKWTVEELRVAVRMIVEGASNREIATALGRPFEGAASKMIKLRKRLRTRGAA